MLLALAALPEQISRPDRPFISDAEYALEEAYANRHERLILRGHAASVRAIAFSPDGTLLATASDDRTVRVWDTRSGAQQATLRHDAAVLSAAFSPDGSQIFTTTSEAGCAWDLKTGTAVATFRGNDVFFSGDGRLVAATRPKEVRILEARTGRELA